MPTRRKVNGRPNDFEKAAITVLKRSQCPLSVREIVDQMIKLRLVEQCGRTPQNSMQNTIRRANEKRKAAKKPPLFVRQQNGSRYAYSLNE